MAPRKVIGHCVICSRERVASDQKFAGEYSGWCASCRWQSLERKETNMNAGISTESMAVQQASSAAQKAKDEFERDEREAQALVALWDEHFTALVEAAPALAAALAKRRRTYWNAVNSERERARAVSQDSREDEIKIAPFRRNVRGHLGAWEGLSEYSVSVPSDTFDDSVLETRSAAFAYQPTAADVPMRRARS